MSRPRLLDLFCGAGGAALGYLRAGFDVIGVDIEPQPNYPFKFVQANALSWEYKYARGWVDAIHASPPCQHYSRATASRGSREDHPDLIGKTRELLQATGLPYVIENVEGARSELIDPVMIDGPSVWLPIRRRRFFETNWPLENSRLALAHENTYPFDHGATVPESKYRDSMGCGWMTVKESREAIPPAYTELIGHQLLQHIRANRREEALSREGTVS